MSSDASKSAIVQNLVASNQAFASTFDKGHLPLPPGKKYAVVTCMDARIDPAAAFGISLGDAHVIRNAGASTVDALRSLVISQQLLGTEEVIVVKHTDCGMLTFKDEDIRAVVRDRLGERAGREAGGIEWLPFPEVEEAVRKDVEFVRNSELIPDSVRVSGWVYEVETGKVRNVV